MVSLALRRLTFYPVLLIVVILIGSVTAMAGDETLQQTSISQTDPIELKYGKMSFTLESSAKFLSRRDDFSYGLIFLDDSPYPIIARPDTNYDSLGGGAGIMVAYPINDKYSIEFSFQGASVSSERTSSFNSGDLLLAYPLIDGQGFGADQQFLVPLTAGDLRTKLEYESWYIDTFLGLNRTVLKKTNTEIHGIVGIAYAHFEQDFEHEITGTDSFNGLPNRSDLDEDLRDNLFGLKGGLRLSHRVTKKFQIEGSIFGGVYYRKSKLDADQTLTNVLIGSTSTLIDTSASVNDRDSHFVPRTECKIKVKYKINDRWDLAIFSGVGAWWHMSKVNNPEDVSGVMPVAGPALIDRPVHIGDNDRLMEYSAGLAITFRH